MSAGEHYSTDTIYAVASGAGKAAIAIIRISGSQTDLVLERLCGKCSFVERRASLASIFGVDGKLLDRAIIVKFAAPRSFTGEPMAELHLTGGRAIIRGVLETLSTLPGTRPANAGEFARRAYQNDKLDLAEIEGLASVVEAETRVQLRHALASATGELSRRCEATRGVLLSVAATIESLLDFSDVEDADSLSADDILPLLREVVADLGSMLDNSQVSERLRDGMSVVIAGPPNAGKSTLLNCLAKRDVAIVSPIAGTTRDSLEVALDVGGFPVIVSDTAGIRATIDPVEAEGIARSRRKAEHADLVIWLDDGSSAEPPEEVLNCPVLRVRSKVDAAGPGQVAPSELAISARTGEGIAELLSQVATHADSFFVGAGNGAVSTERQRAAVRDVIEALLSTVENSSKPPELIAEDLRRAIDALGRVTGRIGVEEVLGEIFGRLCVGK